MLGLIQGLTNTTGGVVLPGGVVSDGDWKTLTVDPAGTWAQVGVETWNGWDDSTDS